MEGRGGKASRHETLPTSTCLTGEGGTAQTLSMVARTFHLLALSALTFLSACSTDSTTSTAKIADSRAWWTGDGVEGSPRIVIDLSEQRLRYFKGDKLVGVSPISSGREGNSTLNGKFRIIEKDEDHRSSLYGSYVDEADRIVVGDVDSRVDPRPPGTKFVGASMRHFMRIVGGIGMHEGYLPGYPASHGCIRLPTRMAAIFYENTPHGTPVEVIGDGVLAASEDAIPLGHDALPVIIASSIDKPASVQGGEPEARRAVLASAPPATPFKRARPAAIESSVASSKTKREPVLARAKPVVKGANASSSFLLFGKRPKPGTTLYLEE